MIQIQNLPFFWRTTPAPLDQVPGIPQNLSFEFDLLEDCQLLIQKRNPEVLENLTKVYHMDANIGFLQEGHALAESYGNDFKSFIEESIAADEAKIQQVTEIGCGGGYVLKNFKNRGKKVRGIDPSPLAERESKNFDFEIIREFYPLKTKMSQSDLMFHYDVLEHVTDPVGFLKAQFQDLNEGGYLVAGMPDAGESIACGDISMAMHEHLNYFDADSLHHALSIAGFSEIKIKTSSHGGLLFCCARKRTGVTSSKPPGKGKEKLVEFSKKAALFKEKIQSFIEKSKSEKNSAFGFYVPLRAFPYMASLGIHQVRLFDDSKSLHQRYYDGCPIKVENFEDLVQKPVTHILVASFPFGEVIKRKIKNHFGAQIKTASLADFREALNP